MILRLALFAGIGYMMFKQAPEIVRYIKMEKMSYPAVMFRKTKGGKPGRQG